ncbi:MAG: stage 0 sporulation family protein [Clostridia bacterium]|nr:stage 0 sporulation family protein [Clostridia bacterium]MBR6565045.1 stage 0 sporulation family protein [Clostridia bacterium]MBR6741338.1 stage 0 sporulation family protein [Clostridia bacterium]
MTEVVSVKFKDTGKSYYFAPNGKSFTVGERVVVETQNGNELGIIAEENHQINEEDIVSPLKKVLRLATDKDLKRAEENKKKAADALKICEDLVIQHKLDMKLVEVEYSFDGSKIVFFFTSDGRVDFRELVKDLAARFHTRIELRQIGVRDEAKLLGGIGICGQPYCCKRFLNDFQPVSIKMAKEQGLSLNPTKISGSCGRLMCCLKYEEDAYSHLASITPRVGATVKTPQGIGTVTDVNLVTGNLYVKLLESDTLPFKIHRDNISRISSQKKPSKSQNDE